MHARLVAAEAIGRVHNAGGVGFGQHKAQRIRGVKLSRINLAGVDQLLCYGQFGYLPHEAVMNSYRLLGEKVIPELEKRGHRLDYEAIAKKAQSSWT